MGKNIKPKLLHVIDSLGFGGAERLLVGVVNNFDDVEHHIISLSARTEMKKELRPDCFFQSLNFKSKRDLIKIVIQISRYIKRHKINLVHSHLVLSNIVARLATPAYIPLFNSLHSLAGKRFFRKKYAWQTIAEKWTYKKRHTIIAVSDSVLQDYQHAIGIKGNAHVLHNFVADSFFAVAPHLYKPTGTLSLVAVGSLKPEKNYQFLIKAFKNLPVSVKLDIYGAGPLREELEKQIEESKVAITLCGNVSDIENVLIKYDLYVMASRYEGHPIALLEAMAAGMPTLVADIPVLKEATGGENFFFCAEDESDFLRKIHQVLNEEINLDKLAASNFSFANYHARKGMYLKKLRTIYGTAIFLRPDQTITTESE